MSGPYSMFYCVIVYYNMILHHITVYYIVSCYVFTQPEAAGAAERPRRQINDVKHVDIINS